MDCIAELIFSSPAIKVAVEAYLTDACKTAANTKHQQLTKEGLTPANIHDLLANVSGNLLGITIGGTGDDNALQMVNWLRYASVHLKPDASDLASLYMLDKPIAGKSKSNPYLVGDGLSLADIAVWAAICANPSYKTALENSNPSPDIKNVANYFRNLSTRPAFAKIMPLISANANSIVTGSSVHNGVGNRKKQGSPATSKQVSHGTSGGNTCSFEKGGSFVELPGAVMGKVVVRFPPEASGYLHVGHAKAVLLNQYYQQMFKGKLILRFDDTNPAKECHEFEQVILKDVEMLGVKYDKFSRTSDHFDTLLKYCEKMLKEGKAYADNTDPEEMKKQREAKQESKCRGNSIEENLKLWNEMKLGSDVGVKCCVRAKIDMSSPNGCLRDPTMYRCKNEPHVETKDKYKVYPTYDFACPVVDSIEEVTHALRTTEYHDRDEQYRWFCKTLGIRTPCIYDYSRLALQHTLLSKRKLTWFVDQGLVSGWDDPRFPTVRGILRKGLTVEGLKQFILAQGSSKCNVTMEWDKVWSFNKKVIDPIVPRYTAITASNALPLNILTSLPQVPPGSYENTVYSQDKPAHPKNPDVGNKQVWYGAKLWIDKNDAIDFEEGTNVTFMDWGNIKIKRINKGADNKITSVDAELNLEDKDYKNTQKITWLAIKAKLVPTVCFTYGHLISKPVLDKKDDFKNYINRDTIKQEIVYGDPMLATLKKGDIIQLQRRGFYICDQVYADICPNTGLPQPCHLIYIPDGHQKEQPTSGSASAKHAAKATGDAKTKGTTDLQEQIRLQSDKVKNLESTLKQEVSVLEKLRFQQTSAPVAGSKTSAPVAGSKTSAPVAGSKTSVSVAESKTSVSVTEKKSTVSPKPTNTTVAPATGGFTEEAKQLLVKIKECGDKIRDMKQSKATPDQLKPEITILTNLKAKFKEVSHQEWKADLIDKLSEAPVPPTTTKSSPAVTKDHKTNPTSPPAAVIASGSNKFSAEACQLLLQIKECGDKIRNLKASKASAEALKPEIANLTALKNKFKEVSHEDWKPEFVNELQQQQQPQPAKDSAKKEIVEQAKSSSLVHTDEFSAEACQLLLQIKTVGDKIRDLKQNKATNDSLKPEIANLTALKTKFKEITQQDWKPDLVTKVEQAQQAAVKTSSPGNLQTAAQESNMSKATSDDKQHGGREVKKVTRLGIEAKQEENTADWFSEVLTKSEMIAYYDVSGCYILLPNSYYIWKRIYKFFDKKIEKMGVQDAYFPLFVSKDALEREKTHIADFAPEVAWVTRAGSSEMAEPIAVRPTSETIMYPYYAKYVQSYRDLPLKLNQWNNVVRWEFKQPQPLLRSREFLWQEGHSAFATEKEALEEMYAILELYAEVYEGLLAIPVVRGKKTEKEKFAGGDITTTVEAYVPASGRGIQGATSHHLGQNFSKMFDISFQDPNFVAPATKQGDEKPATGHTSEHHGTAVSAGKCYVYQNSWGITTRTIGVVVMIHGDNKGLVLPPKVAKIQAVIVPCGITASTNEADATKLNSKCKQLVSALDAIKVRSHADLRDYYSPGWKFNHYEVQGVPLRIEVGPKDMAQEQVICVRRDTGAKIAIKEADLAKKIPEILTEIHENLYQKAKKELDAHIKTVHNMTEFCNWLDKKCLLLAPFCGIGECEDEIKKLSARDAVVADGAPAMGAKSLCIPFKQPDSDGGNAKPIAQCTCINPNCKTSPKYYTLFGRSY